MTLEMAEYYRAMLTVGFRDKLDEAFDYALETEEPLSEITLSLCTCISDNEAVLSVLHNYTIDHKFGAQVVCDLILDDFRSRYAHGELRRAEISCYLYQIVKNLDKFWEKPWHELTWTSGDLEMLEDGLLSEEIFNQCFDAWFFEGKHLNSWEIKRKQNKQNQQSERNGFWSKIKTVFRKQ